MPKLLQIFDLYKTKGYFIFSTLAQDTEFFPFRFVMQHRKDKKSTYQQKRFAFWNKSGTFVWFY